MRCSQCNSRLTKKNKFCPGCGVEVLGNEKETPSVKKTGGVRVFAVIGILLLVVIGALIGFSSNADIKNTIFGKQPSVDVAFSENPEAITAASRSVVKLNCYDRNGNLYATGSGFAVFEKGVIVTNYHVIEDKPSRIEVVTEFGKTCDIGSAIAASVDRDIAILYYQPRLVDFDLPLLPIGHPELLKKGEKVVAIGSPLGLMNVVSTGVFSGYDNIGDATDIQFTASISSGSSGGALFNDKGEVIGVTYASYEVGQNLNLAVPMEFVEALWRENPRQRMMLDKFYDSLIPHYTVDYILENYVSLRDEEFYLDCWISSYGSTLYGYDAFCVSSYADVYDLSQNNIEIRFQKDLERYNRVKMVKVVAYGLSGFFDIQTKHSKTEGFHNTKRSILCDGVEWSQEDNKLFVVTDGHSLGRSVTFLGVID